MEDRTEDTGQEERKFTEAERERIIEYSKKQDAVIEKFKKKLEASTIVDSRILETEFNI